MDSIYLADRLYKIIRTRQTQIVEIITSNQVKDWNDYQNHLGQLDTLNYIAVQPPSTIKLDPVIYEEASDAKKRAAEATSSGLQNLFNRVWAL